MEGKLLLRLLQKNEPADESDETASLSDMRREVETSLLNVHSVYEVASGEPARKQHSPAIYWPALVAAQRIGYLVVAASRSRATEEWNSQKHRQMEKVIRQLSSGIRMQQRPKKHLEIPDMKSYPAINRELHALQDAL